jgi:exodeoxyribonuclease-3
MRLATWNVNSVTARLPRLLDWLAIAEPDVLCLQETKTAAFPVAEVEKLGYQVAAHGTDRWNGVALASRVGLEEVTLDFPGAPGYPDTTATPEPRAIGATCGDLRVWSVYVPNGRTPDSDHYTYKLSWLAALRAALEPELAAHPQLAVCGDFNVAPTDADVFDPAVFVGATHVTGPERAALTQLRALGLVDVMPRSLKGPNPFTYHDYRGGYFHKDMGMRIDLVYASRPLADRVDDAYVDREARKGKGPSDHAPVVVDFNG